MSQKLIEAPGRRERRFTAWDYVFSAALVLTFTLDHFNVGPGRYSPHLDAYLVCGSLIGVCLALIEMCYGQLCIGARVQRALRGLAHVRTLLHSAGQDRQIPSSWDETDIFLRAEFQEILEITEPDETEDRLAFYSDLAYARGATSGMPDQTAQHGRLILRHYVRKTLTVGIARRELPAGARFPIVVGAGGSLGLMLTVLKALQSGLSLSWVLIAIVGASLLEWRNRRRSR